MVALQFLAIQIGLFAVLIFVLKKIFYNDLAKAKDRLHDLNQQNLNMENELKKQILDTEKRRDQILEGAKAEYQKIKTSAQKEAESFIQIIKENAEREKEAILLKTKERYEKLEKEMLLNMEKSSLDTACNMVNSLFSERMREIMNKELINEVINEINDIDKDKLSIHTDKAKIVTPSALNEEQKKMIEALFKLKSGQEIKIEEEIDDTLIMGLKVNLGGLIIDGSLKNKLDHIRRQARLN